MRNVKKGISLYLSLYSFVYKGAKFLAIMMASILISLAVAYALSNSPEVRIFPMEYDQSIPKELVSEIVKMERLSFVKIGQHGYNHSYGESFGDILEGYEILNNYSLDVEYFIPSYEIVPKYEVPAKLFRIPYESGETLYSDDMITYGYSTLDNSKAIAVQIQDDMDMKMLDNITSGRDFQYLRLDDVNTDVMDAESQIKSIYSMIEFCDIRNCTVVIGVIPHVLRMNQSDKSYLFFNKMLIIIGVMMMMPIYLFYFISYQLKRWLK
jgi:hypothetical protein